MSNSLILQAADGALAEVHAQGAHVTRWQPAGGEERLFLSSRSSFAAGAAIRGGVPLIFPQFAALGPLPKHGFARNRPWQCLAHAAAEAEWRLQSDAATRSIWPHDFECRFRISVGAAQLQMEFSVLNTGTTALHFTAALHSYLRVNDIDDVELLGLQGLRYRDKLRGDDEFIENRSTVRIQGEVDRVYLDTPHSLRLAEPQRSLLIEQNGFTDTVVWNPGAQTGAALADLEEDGYRRMLCVEAAIAGRPCALEAGARWQGSQTLTAA